MKRLAVTAAVAFALAMPVEAQLPSLNDDQIDEAIALGKKGDVPITLVGRIRGVSKGDFDVFIEGPIGRIAAAAEQATKQLRPFTRANVTTEMREPLYRVIVERTEHANGRVCSACRADAEGLEKPRGGNPTTSRNPVIDEHLLRSADGEFDVVLATTKGTQRYNVTAKARQKIR